jgi:hypothetical protein
MHTPIPSEADPAAGASTSTEADPTAGASASTEAGPAAGVTTSIEADHTAEAVAESPETLRVPLGRESITGACR